MTMPHLMNCEHIVDGWCLSCVKSLWNDHHELRVAMCLDDSDWHIVHGSATPGAVLIEDDIGHRRRIMPVVKCGPKYETRP